MSMFQVTAVEDEELGLGSEVGGIAKAGRFQIGLGALGERTRITVVALAGRRLDHVARQDQRVLFAKRVHARRVGIGHQQHVGRLDALPAGDRRAVKGVPQLELVVLERLRRAL